MGVIQPNVQQTNTRPIRNWAANIKHKFRRVLCIPPVLILVRTFGQRTSFLFKPSGHSIGHGTSARRTGVFRRLLKNCNNFSGSTHESWQSPDNERWIQGPLCRNFQSSANLSSRSCSDCKPRAFKNKFIPFITACVAFLADFA